MRLTGSRPLFFFDDHDVTLGQPPQGALLLRKYLRLCGPVGGFERDFAGE